VLRSAAAVDAEAAAIAAEDDRRRRTTQRAFVDLVAAAGPLREGLSAEEAADTFSVLGSPEAYARLVDGRRWTPARYEQWLATNLVLLLLPPS
jgi:hypothetical protein